MPTYAIGDVQGCFRTFEGLLRRIDFDPSRDALWLLGDLVGRGPDAPRVLQFVHEHVGSVSALLGNHDLALLTFAEGLATPHASDRLDSVLSAPARSLWLSAMRARPLFVQREGFALVHAGLMPGWTIADAQQRAHEASEALQSPAGKGMLARFLGIETALTSDARLARADETLRVLTCLRTLDTNGVPDARYKGTLADLPPDRLPWFRASPAAWRPRPIAFGHWSALGLHREGTVTALDGGCIWGRTLCAMRLQDGVCFEQPSLEEHPG